jgi:hypothetical protein
MQRRLLALALPPLAVCRYGCAGCCAAPIGVFWLTGIVGMIYGAFGGPLGLSTVSWGTLGLGALLWGIAAVWALLTLKAADEDRCKRQARSLCSGAEPLDESDPLDEVRKAREV